MKRIICIAIMTFTVCCTVFGQNIQHLSVDIAGYSAFYTTQRQTNWCWAACNQMLLNAKGINETQETQVLKLFGQIVNKGAGENYELAKQALEGTYRDNLGSTVTIVPYVSYLGQRTDDPIIIINHLQEGIPIVMATQLHGWVCVGIDYDTNGINYQVTRLKLLNPYTPNGIETYTMQQFLNKGLMGFMTYDIQ